MRQETILYIDSIALTYLLISGGVEFTVEPTKTWWEKVIG